MEDGIFLNRLKSVMWIERYRDPGEVTIIGRIKDGIQDQLPRGSFVSHLDTDEIMIVENHEINDVRGKDALVTITGRSFESYLEQRVVMGNNAWLNLEYLIAADSPHNQAVKLLKDHITTIVATGDNTTTPAVLQGNIIPFVDVLTDISEEGTVALRGLKRGNLHARLLELLVIDDLGVKTIRPGRGYSETAENTSLVIHKGIDRSNSVIFSYDTNEIENADYLWSIKKYKNAASVSGRWINVLVETGITGYDRRIMQVDAPDIDEVYSSPPTGANLETVKAAMVVRGLDALSAQNEIALVKADISKGIKQSIFRQDYDVGDIITIAGDYNETKPMRVTEYVEIMDEKGLTGYPTLSAV